MAIVLSAEGTSKDTLAAQDLLKIYHDGGTGAHLPFVLDCVASPWYYYGGIEPISLPVVPLRVQFFRT
jgi:hypothetical protein